MLKHETWTPEWAGEMGCNNRWQGVRITKFQKKRSEKKEKAVVWTGASHDGIAMRGKGD
jgi:hypothetical protein